MTEHSYTWVIQERNGKVWRVAAMDVEASALKLREYLEAKADQLVEEGWHLSESQGQRLEVYSWGSAPTPRRRKRTSPQARIV